MERKVATVHAVAIDTEVEELLGDEALLRQSLTRLEELGLDWHAAETRSLL